jgi:hypothetical protein
VPLESISRREVLQLATRMAGAEEATGTATGGTTGRLDDTLLAHPNTDQLKGYNVYILDGAGQGDDRIISAFTPADDRVTVIPNFSATINTTSVYTILKRPWRIQWFIDGINHAIRIAREHGVLVPKVVTELIGQDILFGAGNFQRWPSGNAAAPQGWTLDGNSTIARRTESPKTYLQYSPRITSDGTNLGLLSLSITNFGAYRGETLDLRGFMRGNVASRVVMEVTDGVTTQPSVHISEDADLNEWRDTEESGGPAVGSLTVDDNPLELTVRLRITAGSEVAADFAVVRLLLMTRSLFEFDIPQGDEETDYKFINTVEIGRTNTDDFAPVERLENWFRRPQQFRVVDRDATRRLWIERGGGSQKAPLYGSFRNVVTGSPVTQDAPIRIHGQAIPAIISSDDTNVEMNATYLATYAAWHAATTMPAAVALAFGLNSKVPDWERQWRRLLADMDAKPKAGSIQVYHS